MNRSLRLIVFPAVLATATAEPIPAQAATGRLRPLPELEQATLVWDSSADRSISWDTLLARLAKADAVFLGETHLDDTTHRVELHVLDELLRRKDGKVVLSLEMFERDVQPILDRYLRGDIDEEEFLEKARPWGNYRTAYRPLIERAKAAGIHVVAANFPVALRRKLAFGGKEAFDALSPEERALLPEEILPGSEAYWERVDRAVRGHMHAPSGRSPEERLYEGQNLWDNSMGDAVAKAHAARPDHVVLHVAGGFHVAYRDGTVAQFRHRAPESTALVVSIATVPDLSAARPDRDRERADYLVYAEDLARGLWEGTHAVSVPAELRYRLHVPAAAEARPLLVWLPDGVTRPEDVFAFLKLALGDEAAVAVVEHPFPELQDDLAMGGRYVFGDGFRADYGRLTHGVARIVEYLTRRFPLDESRVLVAGAGDGGAAVLWTAMYTEWLDARMLAIDPDDLTRLSMEGLPGQAPPTESLRLLSVSTPTERLEALAGDYRDAGVPVEVAGMAPDFHAFEDEVRKGLGLSPRVMVALAPVYVVAEDPTPRSYQWAALYARNLEAEGKPARVVTEADLPADTPDEMVRRMRIGESGVWTTEHFEDGKGLPLAGGPFGGTTVVVLPDGASDEELAAWRAIEQSRAIKHRSMFANLAVARIEGDPSLAGVLRDLKSRGRNRVLVVPATFCAGPDHMQTLRAAAGEAAEGLDLHWLPGLGAELVRS